MSKRVKRKRSAQSHKNHHKKNAGHTINWRLWGGLAAVLAIVGAAVVLLKGGGDGIPADFVPEVIGAPRVAVAQEVYDYGDVKLDTTIETVVDIQNVGDETLEILGEPQVQVLEGC